MDIRNLGYSAKFARGSNAVAAGTSAINGAAFDMNGLGGPFDCLCIIASVGTLTSTQVTSLRLEGSADGSTNWTVITSTTQGPLADTDSNKILILDVFRPKGFRYFRGVVTRGTANAVLDSMLYIGYNAHSIPITTQDGTVAVPVATAVPALVVAYPTA